MTAATEERVIYVYALIDPRDGRTRYIGQSNNPKERLRGHFGDIRKGSVSAKTVWLRELKSAGLRPSIEILFEGSAADADVFEATTILSIKAHNDDLTNLGVLPVGVGRRGLEHSEETKKKISEMTKQQMADPAMRQLLSDLAKQRPPASDETRAKLSEAGKGRVYTAERNAKLSAALTGREINDTTRLAVAEANSQRVWTDEMRANMSEGHKQRWAARKARQIGVEIHVMAG